MTDNIMRTSFNTGELVRIIHPRSLKKMNVVGIITELKYPANSWFQVWIPDIGREIFFEKDQMERV